MAKKEDQEGDLNLIEDLNLMVTKKEDLDEGLNLKTEKKGLLKILRIGLTVLEDLVDDLDDLEDLDVPGMEIDLEDLEDLVEDLVEDQEDLDDQDVLGMEKDLKNLTDLTDLTDQTLQHLRTGKRGLLKD